MIQATGIHKSYGNLEVLKGIDLHINKKEIVSIVGASGAGKSTLLHIIGTLDYADRGQLIIDGTEVGKLNPNAQRNECMKKIGGLFKKMAIAGAKVAVDAAGIDSGVVDDIVGNDNAQSDINQLKKEIGKLNDTQLAAFRNQKIGFVFQFHHLLPEFTAIENICIPAYIGGMGKKEATERAEKLLDYLNLTDRKDHKPSELSGGEQQRVAVARALVNNPAVVLADEPSGNLDSKSAQELHKLFFRLRDELGQTFVIVTHNPTLAAMSDRTITIKDGRIV